MLFLRYCERCERSFESPHPDACLCPPCIVALPVGRDEAAAQAGAEIIAVFDAYAVARWAYQTLPERPDSEGSVHAVRAWQEQRMNVEQRLSTARRNFEALLARRTLYLAGITIDG